MSLEVEGEILFGRVYRKKSGSGLLVCWVDLLELPKLGLWDRNAVIGLN